jgi:phosphatidate cytidylyltransferase
LGPRFGSAVVLVAVVLVSLWLGGYVFAIVVGGVFAGCYREWETMVTLRPLTIPGMALIGMVFLSALAFPAYGAAATLGVVVLAAMAALVFEGEGAGWRAAGLILFGILLVCALSIRGAGTDGILAGLFLGVSVWFTDTGAFFVGRQLGGEKLAPDISPGKTRSGAIGGFVVAVVIATLVWHFITPAPLWIGALLAGICSILAQLGDLAESALKRRFRIKDSGDIIPGHGGMMDRLDSLTFALIFLFLIGLLHGGADHIAAGILNW